MHPYYDVINLIYRRIIAVMSPLLFRKRRARGRDSTDGPGLAPLNECSSQISPLDALDIDRIEWCSSDISLDAIIEQANAERALLARYFTMFD